MTNVSDSGCGLETKGLLTWWPQADGGGVDGQPLGLATGPAAPPRTCLRCPLDILASEAAKALLSCLAEELQRSCPLAPGLARTRGSAETEVAKESGPLYLWYGSESWQLA